MTISNISASTGAGGPRVAEESRGGVRVRVTSTLDNATLRPVSQWLTADGTSAGNREAAVDSSGSPLALYLEPLPSDVTVIRSLSVYVDRPTGPAKGTLPAMPNGIQIIARTTPGKATRLDYTVDGAIKSHGQLLIFATPRVIDENDAETVSVINFADLCGTALRLDPGQFDDIAVVFRDDLSSLVSVRVRAFGYIEEGF